MIFKIQPLRNLSIFDNMICVPISKVLPKGMSNHPNLEIFQTSSNVKNLTNQDFFSKELWSCYDIYEHNIHNFCYKKSQIKTQTKQGCRSGSVCRAAILVDFMGYMFLGLCLANDHLTYKYPCSNIQERTVNLNNRLIK